MSFFDWKPPPEEESSDPRLNAWKSGNLGAFGDTKYKNQARSAHSAASSAAFSSRASSVSGYSVNSQSTTGPPGRNGTKLPPHLRGNSIASSSDAAPSRASTTLGSQHGKLGTRASPSMNPGVAAKSAKLVSKFPCSYGDCSMGFQTKKAMEKHKKEEHPYCDRCKEDFVDDEDLLNHKIESEDHIVCCICGQDFFTEGGRDRHERQVLSSRVLLRHVLTIIDASNAAKLQMRRMRPHLPHRSRTRLPHLRKPMQRSAELAQPRFDQESTCTSSSTYGCHHERTQHHASGDCGYEQSFQS